MPENGALTRRRPHRCARVRVSAYVPCRRRERLPRTSAGRRGRQCAWERCATLGRRASGKHALPLGGSPADRHPGVPADCREILLPMVTDQLKYHLERQEDLEACCQLLSDILEVLYRRDVVSRGPAGCPGEAAACNALSRRLEGQRRIGSLKGRWPSV